MIFKEELPHWRPKEQKKSKNRQYSSQNRTKCLKIVIQTVALDVNNGPWGQAETYLQQRYMKWFPFWWDGGWAIKTWTGEYGGHMRVTREQRPNRLFGCLHLLHWKGTHTQLPNACNSGRQEHTWPKEVFDRLVLLPTLPPSLGLEDGLDA